MLRVATVNVNGLRAAVGNGMAAWAEARRPTVVTMQEVRAPDALVGELVEHACGAGWHVAHDECAAKGRAGVAVASRVPINGWRRGLRRGRADAPFDASGRWCEADLDVGEVLALGRPQVMTVVSAYVHTGEATSADRMAEKLSFLDAAARRLEALRRAGHLVLLTGDLNVAHREVDLKNWKGNLRNAGFLPDERAWFDRMLRSGWVDLGRAHGGDGPGPYTWWSWRGKAFDIDSGWRIDYLIADPVLACHAVDVTVDRAASYADRWSDHAPVVADFAP